MKKGKIIVYTGPMFSNKSTMLLSAFERAVIAKRSVLAFKPVVDNRFGDSVIKSRRYGEEEAVNISKVEELKNYDADVYIIDEFQFLTGDVTVIDELANRGKIFYIAGLDKTAEGKPFGTMPDLLAVADEVIKLTAVCKDCGEDACNSFYLGQKSQDVAIGNNEYIPLCRDCWFKRIKQKETIT